MFALQRPTCACARIDWGVAGVGQVNSLLLALSGCAAGFVTARGFRVPNYSAASIYLCLSLYALYFIRVRRRAGGRFRLEAPLPAYLCLAFVDAEANFLLVKSLQLTSFASVMVIDCATVPWTMLLSRLFLKAKYRPLHIAGAATSFVGIVLLVLADLRDPSSAAAPHPLLGDLLSVVSSFLFAVSSVLQEALCSRSPLGGRRRAPLPVAPPAGSAQRGVARDGLAERSKGGIFVPRNPAPVQAEFGDAGGAWYPSIEYLAMLGAIGSAIAAAQAALSGETGDLLRLGSDTAALGGLLAYALCLGVAYSVGCFMVVRSSAAFLTLSFLTSDIYSVIAGAVFFGNRFSPLYIFSLAITLSGLVIFLLPSAGPPGAEAGGGAEYSALEEGGGGGEEEDPWGEDGAAGAAEQLQGMAPQRNPPLPPQT
eukprot:tig00000939_g5484.t1